MRKEKFTKGPWRVGPVDDTLVMDANREEIAQALGDHEGEEWESVYANATLISAAPELYEAIHRMQKIILDDDLQDMVPPLFWEISSAALAKARGEA